MRIAPVMMVIPAPLTIVILSRAVFASRFPVVARRPRIVPSPESAGFLCARTKVRVLRSGWRDVAATIVIALSRVIVLRVCALMGRANFLSNPTVVHRTMIVCRRRPALRLIVIHGHERAGFFPFLAVAMNNRTARAVLCVSQIPVISIRIHV